MTLEEAIKTALEFERKVRDSYQTASAGPPTPPPARFSRCSPTRKRARLPTFTPALNTVIPSRERIAAGVAKPKAG